MPEQVGQKGTIVKKGGWWVLRYRATARENGLARRVLRAKRLGLITDYPPKRHKARDGKDAPNAVVNLASEFLADLNKQGRGSSDNSLVRLGEFVDQVFLPFVKAQRRPSTYKKLRRHLASPSKVESRKDLASRRSDVRRADLVE